MAANLDNIAQNLVINLPLPDDLSDDEKERCNNFANKLVPRVVATALVHPLQFCKTLWCLGYEPFPLTQGKAFIFFGREAHYLPNIIQYMRYTYQAYGWKILYKGVDAHVLANVTSGFTHFATELYLDHYCPNVGGEPLKELAHKTEMELTHHESLRIRVRQAIRDSVVVIVATVVSRPFTVIMIREIAQHINNENKYHNVLQALLRIGHDEGPAGYFSGLIPQVLLECSIVWGVTALKYSTDRLLFNTLNHDKAGKQDENDPNVKAVKDTRKMLDMIIPFAISAFNYPYNVVHTVMAVAGSGLFVSLLPYAPTFSHWGDAYDYLKPHGLHRGSRLFMREFRGAIAVGPDHKTLYASNAHLYF